MQKKQKFLHHKGTKDTKATPVVFFLCDLCAFVVKLGFGLVGTIVFITLLFSPVRAQEQECQTALERAEDQYDAGNYGGVIRLLDPCAPYIAEARRIRAYKLLALAHLKIEEKESAKMNVRSLLALKRDFEPDAGQDPQEFVDLVNEVKQELQRPHSKKWLWIGGGGLVAGAVAAYFIFKEEDLQDLPLPPNPPR